MKLKIVQAVKLGTVACLLAVTTQTVGQMGQTNCKDVVTKTLTSHTVDNKGKHIMVTENRYKRACDDGTNKSLKPGFTDQQREYIKQVTKVGGGACCYLPDEPFVNCSGCQ